MVYQICVINPIQTDTLRNSNIRKTKTYNIDTTLIAQCLILKKFYSAKAIAHCRIDDLTNLLYNNSKDKFNYDKDLQLKSLAKKISV